MMMRPMEFEKPIFELYEKIEQLRQLSSDGSVNLKDEIQRIEKRAEKLKMDIYSHLTPNQIIQIARHPDRPDTLSLIQLICDEFIELHGDRVFGDDLSIVGGIARFRGRRLVIIGHQKGHDTKENIRRNFGMPNPEGYRKALRLMKLAEKFQMPIVTFVDTPGAYPGIEAEERGQAEAIARNLREMAALGVPVVSFVLGEGGSGGALGIAVANRVYMLQYSVYSVISPEGCASILYRDASNASLAAENLKITAPDIVKLGVADGIIPEPLGGAHNDWKLVAQAVGDKIDSDLKELSELSAQELKRHRIAKFRQMGIFDE